MEEALMNSTEARTETGEIRDQSAPAPSGTTTPTTEPKADAPAPAATAAPTEYKFTAPEGVSLDTAALEAATPIFKELGLDQARAQRLVDLQMRLAKESQEANVRAAEKMRTEWRAELTADKDIGSKLPEVASTVSKAIDQLPPALAKAFRESMDFTGAGDNPGFVRGMYEFAKLINEGTHVTPGGPSKHGQAAPGKSDRPSLAAAMYPTLPS